MDLSKRKFQINLFSSSISTNAEYNNQILEQSSKIVNEKIQITRGGNLSP